MSEGLECLIANAARLGLSRTECLRRKLTQDAETSAGSVSTGDLVSLSAALVELGELTGMAVLHVAKDFELISVVTGQAVERLSV